MPRLAERGRVNYLSREETAEMIAAAALAQGWRRFRSGARISVGRRGAKRPCVGIFQRHQRAATTLDTRNFAVAQRPIDSRSGYGISLRRVGYADQKGIFAGHL